MVRIILMGASGQLGTDCLHALERKPYELLALTRQELDFANENKIFEVIEDFNPDIVINACAYTAVDKAEEDITLANQINHLSVAALARACVTVKAFLIHISTDYVFDGQASLPYNERDEVNPLSIYGQTKLAGEESIREVMSEYVILRTSWVFGLHGNNFVKTMLRLAKGHDQLSVVSDQVGRPTYVMHIVEVILAIIERRDHNAIPSGVYHCCSQGEVSWCGFAREIFALAHREGVLESIPKVTAIPSSAYPTPAPRPMYSVLDTNKLESYLGQSMPSWNVGLLEFLTKP